VRLTVGWPLTGERQAGAATSAAAARGLFKWASAEAPAANQMGRKAGGAAAARGLFKWASAGAPAANQMGRQAGAATSAATARGRPQ
jgi:hypothetical protein